MSKKRVLTGVTTTGIPHLGNDCRRHPPLPSARAQNPDTPDFLPLPRRLPRHHQMPRAGDDSPIHQAVAATWFTPADSTPSALPSTAKAIFPK